MSLDPMSQSTRGAHAVPNSADSRSTEAGRASYTRPTPETPKPRMVMDADPGIGLDWARKAAQAVAAHVRFMDWVDRPAETRAESPGTDMRSAMSAYGEFSGDEVAQPSASGDRSQAG